MRKPKIYLDTSVISHLKQDDAPDKMKDTLKLWEEIKQGEYEVYVSTVTLEELGACYEPKRSMLLDRLNSIEFTLLDTNIEIAQFANEIINQGILTSKSLDDCTHIALAVSNNCDIIVSWNFKHMVNVKTINGVRAISLFNGYKTIDIYSPSFLIQRGE